MIPIVYPEKLNRVTKTMDNTIFGALSGLWKVSWDKVIQEVIGQLVSNLKKEKPSPISPYFFHLYDRNECLRGREMEDLEVAKKYLEHGITLKTVAHPDFVEVESERESFSSTE